MASVHDDSDEGFEKRVAYSAACIPKGIHSRQHDGCFEMWDGDHVLEALYRRVKKNPESQLAKAFPKAVSMTKVEEVHAELGHLSRKELVRAAREERNRCNARSQARRETLQVEQSNQ